MGLTRAGFDHPHSHPITLFAFHLVTLAEQDAQVLALVRQFSQSQLLGSDCCMKTIKISRRTTLLLPLSALHAPAMAQTSRRPPPSSYALFGARVGMTREEVVGAISKDVIVRRNLPGGAILGEYLGFATPVLFAATIEGGRLKVAGANTGSIDMINMMRISARQSPYPDTRENPEAIYRSMVRYTSSEYGAPDQTSADGIESVTVWPNARDGSVVFVTLKRDRSDGVLRAKLLLGR